MNDDKPHIKKRKYVMTCPPEDMLPWRYLENKRYEVRLHEDHPTQCGFLIDEDGSSYCIALDDPGNYWQEVKGFKELEL